jgi:hypothetical protein
MKLATYLHLVSTLIISGVIPLPTSYAFTALTGTTTPYMKGFTISPEFPTGISEAQEV